MRLVRVFLDQAKETWDLYSHLLVVGRSYLLRSFVSLLTPRRRGFSRLLAGAPGGGLLSSRFFLVLPAGSWGEDGDFHPERTSCQLAVSRGTESFGSEGHEILNCIVHAVRGRAPIKISVDPTRGAGRPTNPAPEDLLVPGHAKNRQDCGGWKRNSGLSPSVEKSSLGRRHQD